MKYRQSLAALLRLTAPAVLALTALTLMADPAAVAQSMPTATQQLYLSAFVGGTGTFTDLEGGKNLAITAGADLTFPSFHLFRPAFEIRGSYPVDSGHISSQKSFLLGPRVEYPLGRLHPYADFLVGRGQIDYLNGGFPLNCCSAVLISNTFVYSPGVGLDYDLTRHLALKADVQFEHWNTPVPPGAIHPTALTLGVVYLFDFNHGHRRF